MTLLGGSSLLKPPGTAAYVAIKEPPNSPDRYGAVGDGVADDTTYVQQAAQDSITARGALRLSGAKGSSTKYLVTSTINIVPPSGSNQTYLNIEGNGDNTSIVWGGGSGAAIFHCVGWKFSKIKSVKISIPGSQTGVIGWDVDTTTSASSTSFVRWENCLVALGTGADSVAWRLGHVSAGAADISCLGWDDCAAAGPFTTVSGQVGWLNEGNNSVNHSWNNGLGSFLDKMVTTVSKAGATNGGGNSNFFFNGLGSSQNNIDFQNSAYGVFNINGGRFESGNRFYDSVSAGGLSVLSIKGVEIDAYNPSDGILFSTGNPTALSLRDSRITKASGAFTSAMFTLSGFTNRGSLIVEGGGIQASDPFWTDVNNLYDIYVRGVGKLTDFSTAAAKMLDRDGPRSKIGTFPVQTVNPNWQADCQVSTFWQGGTTTTTTITIPAPLNGVVGSMVTMDITNFSASNVPTITFGTGIKTQGAFSVGTFATKEIMFRFDGTAWREQYRTAASSIA